MPILRLKDSFYSTRSPCTLQTPGSGISILLAVGTPSIGSGSLYYQWELSPGSGNALCILFPTILNILGFRVYNHVSITAQQAKLDLELVPKEKRLEIGKYLDALPTNEEIVSFLRELGHTEEINSLNDVVVDHMHQPCRTFSALINKSLFRKTTGLDKLRLSKAQILWGTTPPKTARKFKKPVSPKLTTVPSSTEEPTGKSKRVKRLAKKSTEAPARGVIIRKTHEMPLSKKKEKVDVTRGKGIELLSQVALTEDAQFKEVQRKRTSVKPGVPDVSEEESSKSKAESWEMMKMIAIMNKTQVGFTQDTSKGSRTVTKTDPSAAKIKPSITNEGTGVKPGVPDVSEEESSENNDQENDSDDDKTHLDNQNKSDFEHETDESESGLESDHEENKEDEVDEEEVKGEFVKTPSNNFDDEDKTKITDKAEGDEDEEMDYTTSQLYDVVDIRLNEPVDTDKELFKRMMVKESLEDAVLAKESSQPQSSYEAAATLTKFK
nr:hypothetical protein [Tanacetum cinerariifolium]